MISNVSVIVAVALCLTACASRHTATLESTTTATGAREGGADLTAAMDHAQQPSTTEAAAANAHIAKRVLALLGGHPGPDDNIATLFSEDLEWEIPGDVGALPWLGKKKGRGAVEEFMRDTASMIERRRFDVKDILADEQRTVILGELATRVTRTNRTIEGPFAIILTISGGRITRLLMLEDSFAVSQAAR